MLKKLSVLLSLTLVVTLLSLNGCSKSDAPTSPGTTDVQNQSAPTGQFDPDFPSIYADEVVQPIVPTSGDVLSNRYIQFIVKFVGLNADQQAALQKAYAAYNRCLLGIRADIKNGKYSDPTSNKIDRQSVLRATKACYTDYQNAITELVSTFDADQLAKWKKLFRLSTGGTGRIGDKRGIVADGLIDELEININHNDATLNSYENEVTESTNPSVMMDPRGPRGFLGFLIRALKLNDDQIAAIKTYLQEEYNASLKDAFTTLRTANHEALVAFKAAIAAATTDAERQAAKAAYQAALKAAAQAARASVKTAHDAWIAFMTGTGTGSAGLDDNQIALFKRIFRIK